MHRSIYTLKAMYFIFISTFIVVPIIAVLSLLVFANLFKEFGLEPRFYFKDIFNDFKSGYKNAKRKDLSWSKYIQNYQGE